jgi:hypothetical protein
MNPNYPLPPSRDREAVVAIQPARMFLDYFAPFRAAEWRDTDGSHCRDSEHQVVSPSTRQPMSRRQKPSPQSMRPIAA